MKVRLVPVNLNDVIRVRGEFVSRDDFEDVFENYEDIYKYFESEIVLGAIVDHVNKRAYIVTVSPASTFESQITTLTVWTLEIE
jgi:hypothetical protein